MNQEELQAETGQVRAALRASQAGPAVLARLSGSAALEVRGPDAATFLHGQLTNDVTGLRPGATCRSLLLNHKGHAMAEAQVLRLAPQHLLLVVDDDRASWVRETLERHIVFDEVTMAPTQVAVLTLQGAAVEETLSAVQVTSPPSGEFVVADMEAGKNRSRAHVYAVGRSGAGGFDVALVGEGAEQAAASCEAALIGAGALAVSEAAVAAARVAALVPTAGADGGEGVLPQEVGLEGYVSFRKGCYLGQEIMARIEARGSVRRRLARLELDGGPDGREVTLDGRKVGQLGTTVTLPDGRVMALAVLRADIPEEASLSAGGVSARLDESPARMMRT